MLVIDLGGTWTLVRRSDSSTRPATIPGDIISALVASGELADPYFGRNELDAQWVGREDWILAREFTVDRSLLSRREVFLDIEALDTLGELSLNGHRIGSGESMFTRLRLDAGPALREGRNHIEVLIRSPEAAARAAAEALPYPLPYSAWPVQSPHRNLLRKSQCMAGWDCGPCLMTGGIYDGISLVGIDAPRIEYLSTTSSRLGEGRWELSIEVELAPGGASAGAPERARVEAEIAGRKAVTNLELGEGRRVAVLRLELEGIATWWPAGCGAQPLYDLVVRSHAPGPAGKAGEEDPGSHRLSRRIGFRELEVLSEPDGIGRSLRFRVNGRDIFAKGANWVPADALPSRWTKERLADLLGSAAAAHMNMLRVWGGGRYESEDFYGLCDELGLLVWQDAMFSRALYPSTPGFLALVEAELRHQVRRLRDHPSLALWCGNNELIGAMGWYEESRRSPARYIVDYDRLNVGTIGRVVRELDPGRTFWPSSPSAGPDDFSDNWHLDTRGDMHCWTVWDEGKPFSAYLESRPRFCSEFGFQSLPSWRMAAVLAPEGERNITSPAFEHHQRHPRGNAVILETMSRYFRMPRGFRESLWLSQVQQALAIRTAVEYWRGLRERCMGTLYWQLNDLWPTASWSSLDHDGSWKLLHYEARRFYDPVIVALHIQDGVVHAVGVNDSEHFLYGILSIRVRRFDGSLVMDIDTDGDLPPASATPLWKAPVSDLPCRPEEVYLAVRLEASPEGRLPEHPALISGVPSRSGGKAEVVRRNQIFLVEPKRCALADPQLTQEFQEDSAGSSLLIKVRHPAFYVTAEVEGLRGRWDDAGFYMMGREERRLHYIPARGEGVPTREALEAATKVTHLRASYD